MAAVAGLLLAKLRGGDEVVIFDECYHRTREFCTKCLGEFGVVTPQGPCLRLRRHGGGHQRPNPASD